LSFAFYRVACLLFALGFCLAVRAQNAVNTSSAATGQPGYAQQVPRVPGISTFIQGLNAGVTLSGAHNSQTGWYNVVTPAVGYTFSQRYSADASLSIYPYRQVETYNSAQPDQPQLVVHQEDLGDTLVALHAAFTPSWLRHTATASLTIPTGNRADGLSTGRVTFDFSDHMEHYIKRTGLLLDLGAGDSSGLFNRFLTNNYTSLGPLAHFQTGFVTWLPGRSYIECVAYEQLPIGDQKLYTTLNTPGRPPITVVTGSKVSEDNGFTTFLGIPLTDRLTASSYYNRSLRHGLDTVSIGITYVLRGTPRSTGMSLVDRALREAERTDR
jgi:hypothetical protein